MSDVATGHQGGAVKGPVAIIGAGSIGIAFAIVFARAAFPVRLQDPDPTRRSLALREVEERLQELRDQGLLAAGSPAEEPAVILARIDVVASLEEAVAQAILVQECAPEQLDLKRHLLAALDKSMPLDVVLASSSSALTASALARDLQGSRRCLIAHPANPPYLIPIIEIVPAPFTAAASISRAEAIYTAAGLSPIRINREVEGFVFNRLQGALLREAYCLVRDEVATVDDIDRIVRDGLGLRWSVIGPFETADLNTRGGIASHAEKMGPAYARMGAERGQRDPWTAELVAKVAAARRALLPLEAWEKRVKWRDSKLMQLIAHRRRVT